MPMVFKFFKSKSERERLRLAKEAELERAHDLGREIAREIMARINAQFEEVIIPALGRACQSITQSFESLHKDGTINDVLNLSNQAQSKIDNSKREIIEGIWIRIGDLKYLAIEHGIRDDIQEYIERRLTPLFQQLQEQIQGDRAYAILRITGHVTDEMHAMSTDELAAYVKAQRETNEGAKE